MDRSRKIIIIIAFLSALTVLNYFVIRNSHTVYVIADVNDLNGVSVTMDRDDVVKVKDIQCRYNYLGSDDLIIIKLKAVGKGDTGLTIKTPDPDLPKRDCMINVDSIGLITEENFAGSLDNIMIIRYEIVLILLIMIVNIIFQMEKISRESRYSYKLMFYSGSIAFLTICAIIWIWNLIFINYYSNTKLYTLYNDLINSFHIFAIIVFPFIFLLAIFLIISNIVLIRHEGKKLTNMLGIALGIGLVIMTIISSLAYYILGNVFNVHSYGGIHFELAIESIIDVVLCYLECMMIGTYIWTVRAAKHVPAFDKDYVIILGCSIRNDGTVTPLLKGRTDRAIWFAEKQKKESGKDIKFVASGGKGDDEVVSESEAIKNYLVENGISEDQILMEDKSTTTYENMKFSYNMIEKDFSDEKNNEKNINDEKTCQPAVIFSTTGYHVFRGGHIAASQGIKVSGIGSRTKWYFHVNALIREFVANMNIERKKHIKNVAIIIFIIVMMLTISYVFKFM